MTIKELSKEQRLQLKQQLLDHKMIGGASYDELARADELIPDGELDRFYENMDFVEEDFSGEAK